jgi:hypothetical protein
MRKPLSTLPRSPAAERRRRAEGPWRARQPSRLRCGYGRPATARSGVHGVADAALRSIVTNLSAATPRVHVPVLPASPRSSTRSVAHTPLHVRSRTTYEYFVRSGRNQKCQRRLGFLIATGRNGGTYDYFFCYGRQSENGCDLPFLATDEVEEGVTRAHGDIELGSELGEEVREQLLGALKRSTAGLERQRSRQEKRVKQLENERRRLVRAHLDGAIPVDLLKEEQDRIADEMAQAQRQLNATDVDWNTVETNLTLALGLVSGCK